MEAIANWLWQGMVVAAAATVLVRTPRSIGATARYRLWWAALAIVLALPFVPAIADLILPADAVDVPHRLAPMSPPVQVRLDAPRWAPTALASIWIGWIAFTATRVLSALIGLRRARGAARPFPAARASRLEHWTAVSARGRRAALVISEDVRYAAVLGGRTPAIAVSPAVAAGLDDRDLDRIVVHEWAHVQRRDDRARLVQLIVRAVAGLHPGVWWLDRQIHIDCETACDDWAVNVTGSAKSYAASLTRLAVIDPGAREDILQPAAITATSSELTRRVMRLLDDRRSTSTERWHAASALVVPALVAAAFAVSGVSLIGIDHDAAAAARSALPIGRLAADADRLPAETLRAATQSAGSFTARQSRAAVGPAQPVRTDPASTQPPAAPPAVPPRVDQDHQPAPDVHADIAPGLDVNVPRELPGIVTNPFLPAASPLAAPPPPTAHDSPKSPWGAAADAGVNVGRGSQKAAVATAGLFSKLGKSIARSF